MSTGWSTVPLGEAGRALGHAHLAGHMDGLFLAPEEQVWGCILQPGVLTTVSLHRVPFPRPWSASASSGEPRLWATPSVCFWLVLLRPGSTGGKEGPGWPQFPRSGSPSCGEMASGCVQMRVRILTVDFGQDATQGLGSAPSLAGRC